ncbi:MAG: glycosyltransferase family 39 protein [Anaerolineae bacterium]|nr:glycosyltransferase family 39 protein [Anaerolineae bacterium]
MSPCRKDPPVLLLLLTAFTALVLLHTVTAPLFEAPDEIWHYAYARWLAEGHGLPSMLDDSSGANQEVAQPPLYYAVSALLSAPFDDSDRHDLSWHNPGFGYQAPGITADNKNMLIHTEREGWPWQGAVLAIHAARLASLLFGLLAVAAAWGLGWETFQSRKAALFTAALIAFQPQFVFISSVVSNDSAAAALATAALWSMARILRRGLTLRRTLLAGVLSGLAILAKTSALPLLPLLAVTLLWAGWQQKVSRKQLLAALLTYGLAAMVAGGWWYLRNVLLYGDPLGLSSHLNTLWGRPEPVTLWELGPELPLLLKSFWAAYGWGHVFWPDWVYGVLIVGNLGFLALGTRELVRGWRKVIETSNYTLPQPPILAMAAVWGLGILAALLYWMQQVEAPHGRLLFPALGAWALIMATGMAALQRQKRDRLLVRGFLLSMASVAALAPGARIVATFAPPRLHTPEQVRQETASIDLTYEDEARLISASVNQERLSPGQQLEVRACWEALRPMTTEYTVFVHLLGPENQLVATRHTYPGLGKFPTTLWPVGKAFCDTYRMDIELWAETPMVYKLEVGLFNAETGGRLSVVNRDGEPASPPIVAQVAVVESAASPPPPTEPLEATLGDALRLRGYEITPTAAAGETLTVTLHWEALEDIDEELVVFVHLWQPGDSSPLAQNDAPPRQGWFPTTVWQRGDRVPDAHPLELPAELAPGDYPLWAGVYRAADGTRLPAQGPQERYPYDLVPLGTIRISK